MSTALLADRSMARTELGPKRHRGVIRKYSVRPLRATAPQCELIRCDRLAVAATFNPRERGVPPSADSMSLSWRLVELSVQVPFS
jgi:hypothetical protein